MNPTMDYLIAMKDIYKVPFNDSEKELLKLLISKTSSPLIYEAPEDLEFLVGTKGVGYLKEKADDNLRLEPLSGVTKDGWSSPDKSVPLKKYHLQKRSQPYPLFCPRPAVSWTQVPYHRLSPRLPISSDPLLPVETM